MFKKVAAAVGATALATLTFAPTGAVADTSWSVRSGTSTSPYRPHIGAASPIYRFLPYSEAEPPPTTRYPATDVTAGSPCVIGSTAYWTGVAYQDGNPVPAAWFGGLGQGEDYCDDGYTSQTFVLYRDTRPYLHSGWLRVRVSVADLTGGSYTEVQRRVWVPKPRR